MNFIIEDDKEIFKPVSVKFTFQTLEELQEFQIRMDLYASDLKKVRPKATLRVLGQENSKMKGIMNLRDAISKRLGSNSLGFDFKDQGW